MDSVDKNALLKDLPNCWEVERCAGDVRNSCPAYPEHGRECWMLTGTKCDNGAIEKASLSDKILHCRNKCDFYKKYISRIFH